MALSKRTYTANQTIITSANLNDIQQEIINTASYATCSTAAGTAAKTASRTNFTLVAGANIRVKFSNTNTATNPTLDVNSTGAKSIMRYGTTNVGNTPLTSWSAGQIVSLTYDGTNWVMDGQNNVNNLASLSYTEVSVI